LSEQGDKLGGLVAAQHQAKQSGDPLLSASNSLFIESTMLAMDMWGFLLSRDRSAPTDPKAEESYRQVTLQMYKDRFKSRTANIAAEARALGIPVPSFPEPESVGDIRAAAQVIGTIAPTQQPQQQIGPYQGLSNSQLRENVTKFVSKLRFYALDEKDMERSIQRSGNFEELWSQDKRDKFHKEQQEEYVNFQKEMLATYLRDYYVEAVNLTNEMISRTKTQPSHARPKALVDGTITSYYSMLEVVEYMNTLADTLGRN
jgi:hypothetical protein